MIIIVPVTKDEAEFIRKRFPKVHVSKQTTHGRRFMEENVFALKYLEEYRSSKTYKVGGNKWT